MAVGFNPGLSVVLNPNDVSSPYVKAPVVLAMPWWDDYGNAHSPAYRLKQFSGRVTTFNTGTPYAIFTPAAAGNRKAYLLALSLQVSQAGVITLVTNADTIYLIDAAVNVQYLFHYGQFGLPVNLQTSGYCRLATTNATAGNLTVHSLWTGKTDITG